MIKTSRHQYSIEESVAAFYAVELINMVHRLHQCHVIHGDIKPDNIMIMDIRCVQYYHSLGNSYNTSMRFVSDL